MSALRFMRRRRGRLPGRAIAFALGAMIVGGLASLTPSDQGGAASWLLSSAQAGEIRVRFKMCGRIRHTCVVDGDTIWLNGVNLRLEGYDTPEPYTDICGGAAEVALARRASARLLELLNANAFSVETGGIDRTGKRTLATIRIGGRNVGDILIAEGLARKWPNGREFWCR